MKMKLYVQDFLKEVECDGVSYDIKKNKLVLGEDKFIAYIKETAYGIGYYSLSNAPVIRLITEEDLKKAIDEVKLKILWIERIKKK